MERCAWAESSDLMRAYHDDEWGIAVREDRKLFEFLVLESAQAGLSWSTILTKREGYRAAFYGFDPRKVARMTEADVQRLLGDASIVRNSAKIRAAIGNAKAFLAVQQEFGSFASYIWSFVNGEPVVNSWRSMAEIPAETALSRVIAKDLRKRGFRFLGPTTVYAHMQATGMVNDHLLGCPSRT